MTRLTAAPRNLVLAAIALFGFAACSSDSNKTTIDDLSTIDVSIPTGVTLPPGVTLPAGVTLPTGMTGDCQAVYLQFITAMTSAFAPTGAVDYSQVFGDVSAAVPADLQDDLAILSAAFQEYGAILVANNNDATSAEVQAAIQKLATPEVNAASTTVQAYFEETCPQG